MFVKKKSPHKEACLGKEFFKPQTLLSESFCSHSWGSLFRSQSSVLTAWISFQNCLMTFRMCSLLSLVRFRCQCSPFDFCYLVHSYIMGLGEKNKGQSCPALCKIVLIQLRTLSPHDNFTIMFFLIEAFAILEGKKKLLYFQFISVLFWIETVY